jgi:sugar O-acyltransferase (sialic acid O-acetyltransferase NeuD family)
MTDVDPLLVVVDGDDGAAVLAVIEAINAERPTYDARVVTSEDLVPGAGRYVVGATAPAHRAAVDAVASALGLEPATLIHPTATFGADDRIGPGVVLGREVRVTTNVTIGRHVLVGERSTVSHDDVIGDHCTLGASVNLAGAVTLGERVMIGDRSVVIQGCSVGARTVVRPGAVVIRDLPPDMVAEGVPAVAR